MNIKVTQVYAMENYKLHVYFEDGRIKCYDASELITSGSYRVLEDVNIFVDRCKVHNGDVAWDIYGDGSKLLDISAYQLYNSGDKITID